MSEILSIDYKDFLINQKRLPDKTSVEYKPFFEFHKRLCIDGAYVDGTFFNPFLMWHLNMWHTEVDVIDDKGRISQKYINPYLRDNEWIITNEIYRANQEKKGLMLLGLRRLAKSVLEASYIAWGASFDENSQNVIAGLNSPDIKLITDKLDKGLNFLPEYYRWQRVEDNWKNQVTLGIKGRGGERYPFSYILIRNLDEGNNEEAIAGTKPRKLIIDEIGKGNWIRAFQAGVPGFTTPFGWGCSPILTGTGGDMKKFMDAKQAFFDVEAFNFLSYNHKEDTRRVHGLFLGHTYRMEAKEEKTLGEYLNKPKSSTLYEIKMQVSNPEKADKITDDILEKLKKSSDRTVYLKEKMYYPKTVDDIFLNEDTNIFDIDGARRQQIRLKSLDMTGTPVILFEKDNGVGWEFTDKRPISSFPVKPGEDKDAPVIIYEFPIPNPPYGLYVSGVDSYRQGQAKYSDSLGTIYIYKRMHDIISEKYQDMLVASYAARPDNKRKWEKQAELLIQMYNARSLVENDEMSFINHMISVNKAHYLEKQPEWIKEIVPNTTVNREYGIHRSAQKIIDFLWGGVKRYTEEPIFEEKNEEGIVIKRVLGMHRIPDPMLLEEIIQYNEIGNFDRLVAFSLTLAMVYKMDPIFGRVREESDPRIKALYKPKEEKHLFNPSRGLFIPRKRKIFV